MIDGKKLRRLSMAWHRDLGYFFSSLIIVYCISGIALNHTNDWNPDFIIHKQTVQLTRTYSRQQVNDTVINTFGKMVMEDACKIYDFPTPDQVKVYYDNATLHVNFVTGTGEYEKVTRRPVFYESNVLHRNSLRGWKWVSDVFAFMLVLITITGLVFLKGKYGFRSRGVWFLLAGLLLPTLGIVLFYIL